MLYLIHVIDDLIKTIVTDFVWVHTDQYVHIYESNFCLFS